MANCSSHELLTICRTCLPGFDFINVAAALHRIAKLRCSVEAKALLPALCDKAVCSIASGSFQAQGLANTAWALATMKLHEQPVLAMIAEVSQTCIAEFRAQEIANIAWAFATLDYFDKTMLEKLA